MQPLAVHHVSINVSDVERAVGFYRDVLGLAMRTDRPDLDVEGVWLDAGGQQLHLIAGTTPPAEGQHFALLVDDLDGVVSELRGHGLRVSTPAPVGAGRQSFLHDPDGNLIELHAIGRRQEQE